MFDKSGVTTFCVCPMDTVPGNMGNRTGNLIGHRLKFNWKNRFSKSRRKIKFHANPATSNSFRSKESHHQIAVGNQVTQAIADILTCSDVIRILMYPIPKPNQEVIEQWHQLSI